MTTVLEMHGTGFPIVVSDQLFANCSELVDIEQPNCAADVVALVRETLTREVSPRASWRCVPIRLNECVAPSTHEWVLDFAFHTGVSPPSIHWFCALPSAGRSRQLQPRDTVMARFNDELIEQIYNTRFAPNVPEHVSIAAHEMTRVLVAARSLQDVGILEL